MYDDIGMEETNDVLSRIYLDPRTGFMGLNELIKKVKGHAIHADAVRDWYLKQAVN